MALIKGRLKEYINKFLFYLQDLNRELSKKRVYPYVKAREIRDNIKKVGGRFETVKDFEDEMLIFGNKILELQGKSYPVTSARDTVRMLEELRRLRSNLIIVPGDVAGEEYVIAVKAFVDGDKILNEFAFPLTALGIAMALSEKVKGKPVTSAESLFYLMVKVLFGGANKKGLDRSDVSLLKIATRADPNQLETMNIVKRGKDREYVLVEPSDASKFESFLKSRGIDVRETKAQERG